MTHDTDVLVIGSGFGGSVTALRLTEKGYDVTVVEAGKRWTKDTLPTTNWDARNFYWFPRLGMRGFQRMTLLNDVFILSGAAVGGGSVVYANTLYEPLPAYYHDRQWAHITDWRAEMAPHYDNAKRMLGVNEVPFDTPNDEVLKGIAKDFGVEDTFHKTEVGVYFGTPGKRVADPYFGGEGPDRVGCIRCGNCMVGCRHEAKNSLDQNYLHLAEKNGTTVLEGRKVTDVRPLPDGGYEITHDDPGLKRDLRTMTATQVVFSAGALGTMKLLLALKDEGRLPHLSDTLGSLTRTNSEAIVGAVGPQSRTPDLSTGVAITSSIHPDEDTHIEIVRYGKGSNAMGMITGPLVDGGGRIPRWLRLVLTILLHPILFLKSLSKRKWSERSVILLVMQTLDNSLRVHRRTRGPLKGLLTTSQGHGEPNPTWIPQANAAARSAARQLHGQPMASLFEATLNTPTTAHIIGGSPIGDSPETGVIDPYHRVYGHPGLHVADGSAITANLGVNPSLSITAMTERAMSFWPNKGDEDPRPPLGEPYAVLDAVRPHAPAVPDDAPAALRTT